MTQPNPKPPSPAALEAATEVIRVGYDGLEQLARLIDRAFRREPKTTRLIEALDGLLACKELKDTSEASRMDAWTRSEVGRAKALLARIKSP